MKMDFCPHVHDSDKCGVVGLKGAVGHTLDLRIGIITITILLLYIFHG